MTAIVRRVDDETNTRVRVLSMILIQVSTQLHMYFFLFSSSYNHTQRWQLWVVCKVKTCTSGSVEYTSIRLSSSTRHRRIFNLTQNIMSNN